METLVNDVHPKHLHLIAHSMGARVLAGSLDRIVTKGDTDSSKPFENIVLAAADLDPRTFEQALPDLRRLGSRITMYVCNCDLALKSSQLAHEGLRIGTIKTVYEGVDVMDADTADLESLFVGHTGLYGILNHSYLLASQLVLYDMFSLINQNSNPDIRPGVRRNGCCWVFQHR